MASSYGVSLEGFRKKRLFDIKTEIEQTLKASLGNNINLLSSSVLSQLIGSFAERESLLWELAEQVYNSQYLYAAEGVNLDNVVQLLGVTRLGQTKSYQQALHLFGDVGTVVPVGTQVAVQGSPTSIFETISEVTLVAGVDEVQNIAWDSVPASGSYRLKYVNEETSILNFDANAAAIQAALNALPKLEGMIVTGDYVTGFVVTFASESGKINHELLLVTSNTTTVDVVVTETTAGETQGVTDAQCTTFGPVVAPAFSLNQIVTPVVGLNGATNPEDAIVGRNVETDSELRVRAAVGQKSRGAATIEAIKARLLEVTDVTQVTVFNNDSDVVDSNGLPAKSFRAYVQGGDDQDIFDELWQSKPAGIRADGDILGTVIDSQGISQSVRFARPVVKNVYIQVNIYKDSAKFPLTGLALVKDTLAAYVNSLNIGDDLIVYPNLIGSLDTIPGINDVEIGVGFTSNPPIGQDTNLAAEVNEILKIINSGTDIVVNIL